MRERERERHDDVDGERKWKSKNWGKKNRNPDQGDVQLSRDKRKKKKEEKIYQKTSTDAGHDVVVVVVQACPEIKSSVDCPFPIINFVPKRKTLNANFIHGI